MFDRAWFTKHQTVLLTLLGLPVVGRLFRWALCIRPCDVGYRGRIVAILPHAYIVANRDGSRTLDCRTHPKYAKRLYFAFWPVWWTLHAWDYAIANPLIPALNAGFDTLTAYPDAGSPGTTTCDGNLHVGIFGDTWANVIAANANDVNVTGTGIPVAGFVGSPTASQWSELWRAMFLFDTSLLAGASPTAATLSIAGSAKQDDLAASPTFDVYTATPASNTTLATTDMTSVGSVSQTGSAITYAAWSTAGYNDFTLNATGRGNISTTGVSKFAVREASYDVAASAPPYAASTRSSVSAFFADEAGSASDPKLVVTFLGPSRKRVTRDQNKISGVGNFTNSASTSLAFSSAVSAGQLLTLCFTGGSSNGSSGVWISTVTDTVNAAGKWLRAIRQASTVGGSSLRTEIWYACNSSAGTPTVTVTLASTAAGRALFGIQSWSDASTIVADVLGSVASTAGNSSLLASPTLSSLSSGSVVVACWKTSAGVTNRTNPSGWSTIAPQNSTRENTFYQLQTSTTPSSGTWQISAASQYVVAMAEFKGSTFTPSTSGSKPDGCSMLRMGVC